MPVSLPSLSFWIIYLKTNETPFDPYRVQSIALMNVTHTCMLATKLKICNVFRARHPAIQFYELQVERNRAAQGKESMPTVGPTTTTPICRSSILRPHNVKIESIRLGTLGRLTLIGNGSTLPYGWTPAQYDLKIPSTSFGCRTDYPKCQLLNTDFESFPLPAFVWKKNDWQRL